MCPVCGRQYSLSGYGRGQMCLCPRTKLTAGSFEIADGKVVGFKRDGINCSTCNDTGKVWVDYGDCEDPWCTAHKGYEDCESCNVRNITK